MIRVPCNFGGIVRPALDKHRVQSQSAPLLCYLGIFMLKVRLDLLP